MSIFPTDLFWHGVGHRVPAAIPGRLIPTLCEAGLTEDPADGFFSRHNEWIALRRWTLAGRADISTLAAERVFLRARGVRGTGVLRACGEVAGTFSPGDFEIEITAQTIGKETVDFALEFEAGMPIGNPPQACIGVDDGIHLRGVNQLRVTDLHVTPRIVDGYGMVEARTAALPYVPGRYTFRYAAVLDGETLAAEEFTEKLSAAQTVLTHRLVLPLPRRFMPGAQNAPVTLRLTVTRAGLVCDDCLLTTGFLDTAFADAPPMQLLVDGARVFLCGAEWPDVPLSPAEIDRRLSLLAAAHINCVRVYGLGADALYDALDSRGLLLWQVLPTDVTAAEMVIRRVRHRPSLIAYGCESIMAAFNHPANALHPTVAALSDAVIRLDGRKPFFGPIPGGQVAQTGRDDFGAGRSFDVLGPTGYPGPERLCRDMNLDDALIRTIACPAPELSMALPPDEVLHAHHGAPMPDIAALREWCDPGMEDAAKAARLLRALQAETVRYTVERARMRAANASGVFVADPFGRPGAPCSTALFDGETPRPAYFALESALRPLHGVARLDRMGYYCGTAFEAKIGLLADNAATGPVTVRAYLYLPDGSILAHASFEGPSETSELGFLAAPLPDNPCALTLRVTVERFLTVLDVTDYTICVGLHALLWPLAHAPFAAVHARDGLLANDCGQTAHSVCCSAYADDKFPGWGALLPGETRTIRQENGIEGLNLEPNGRSF